MIFSPYIGSGAENWHLGGTFSPAHFSWPWSGLRTLAPPGAAGSEGHVATPCQGAGGPLPRATREVSEMLTVPFFFFSTCPAAVFLKFSHFLAPRPWREIFAPGEPPSPCVDLTGGRMAPCRPPRFSQCLHQREYAMKERRRPWRGGPGGSRRCSAPPRPAARLFPRLTALPRGTSCKNEFQFEIMCARRHDCALIINARRSTVGSIAHA